MEKILFLAILLFSIRGSMFGQSVDCSNISFEERVASGWILVNGYVRDVCTAIVHSNKTPGIYANGLLVTKVSDGNYPDIARAMIPIVSPSAIGKYTQNNGVTNVRIRLLASLGEICQVGLIPLDTLDEFRAMHLDYKIVFRTIDISIMGLYRVGESMAVGILFIGRVETYPEKSNQGRYVTIPFN